MKILILYSRTHQHTVVSVSIRLVHMWPLMPFYDIQTYNCTIFLHSNSDLHRSKMLVDTHAGCVELDIVSLKQDSHALKNIQ